MSVTPGGRRHRGRVDQVAGRRGRRLPEQVVVVGAARVGAGDEEQVLGRRVEAGGGGQGQHVALRRLLPKSPNLKVNLRGRACSGWGWRSWTSTACPSPRRPSRRCRATRPTATSRCRRLLFLVSRTTSWLSWLLISLTSPPCEATSPLETTPRPLSVCRRCARTGWCWSSGRSCCSGC